MNPIEKNKVQVLFCSHNRRELTLRCLDSISKLNLPRNTELAVTLLDDCSTDGTANLVRSKFPYCEVLDGTGSLYWAGGMKFAYQHVKQRDWTHLLVLNDDVVLRSDALERMWSDYLSVRVESRDLCILSGCTSSEQTKKVSYGGVLCGPKWHPLKFRKAPFTDGKIENVDTINMNCTLISRAVIREIGFLASYFVHNAADYEYGLRLKRAGGKCYTCSQLIGNCEPNTEIGTSRDLSLSILDRYKKLLSVKEQPFRQRFNFFREYGGALFLLLFLIPYIRLPFDSMIGCLRRDRSV